MAVAHQSSIMLILSLIVAFCGVLFMRPGLLDTALLCGEAEILTQTSCQEDCLDRKPHQASWTSWYHPNIKAKVRNTINGVNTGAISKNWNILYHLGGAGPWVEKNIDVVEGGIAPPEGCEIQQVHMVRLNARREKGRD